MVRAATEKPFLSGFLAASIAVSAIVLVMAQQQEQPFLDITRNGRSSPADGTFDPTQSPLSESTETDMEHAQQQTNYKMPVPPSDERTGERAGMWIDGSGQVAITWHSGLRMYADDMHGVSAKDTVKMWSEKTKAGEGYALVDVEGQPGILRQSAGGEGASLTFISHDVGTLVQFVAESHTGAKLQSIANDVGYEK